MITSLDKKYFVLFVVLFGMSNISAMFRTAEQKKIDSQLEQQLENAHCNQTISIDYRASKSLQDTVTLHNSRAEKICKMAEEYNQNCLNEKDKKAKFFQKYGRFLEQLSFNRKKY